MLEFTEYVKIFIGLLAIVNPIGAIPIFMTLTASADEGERLQIARIVVVAVAVILLAALFFGELLLAFFGITISSFKVGGGILVLLMAIAMLQARTSPTVHTHEEAREGEAKDSVAVVPLSTPLLAGPGAISSTILYAQKGSGFGHYALVAAEILLLTAALWVIFQAMPWIRRRISRTGINIFTRIMGLILAAIAVEFIAGGIKGLFPALS